MKKSIIIIPLILIAILGLIFAWDEDTNEGIDNIFRSPEDGAYNLNSAGNSTLICNATPHGNYTLENITLWMSFNTTLYNTSLINYGEFKKNRSLIYPNSSGTSVQAEFWINATPDGQHIIWACEFSFNNSAGNKGKFINITSNHYNGTAPDIGAYEYQGERNTTLLGEPTLLTPSNNAFSINNSTILTWNS